MLVLQTLTIQRMHGYAIVQHIKRLTDDALNVEAGSLYPALERLEKKGWLTSRWEASPTGRHARYYTHHRGRPKAARQGSLRLRSRRVGHRARARSRLIAGRRMSLIDGVRYRLRVLLRADVVRPRARRRARASSRSRVRQKRSRTPAARCRTTKPHWRARREFGNVTYSNEERRTIAGLTVFDAAPAGRPVRVSRSSAGAPRSPPSPSPRSRSASAPRRRSSPSPTPCSFARSPSRTPID